MFFATFDLLYEAEPIQFGMNMINDKTNDTCNVHLDFPKLYKICGKVTFVVRFAVVISLFSRQTSVARHFVYIYRHFLEIMIGIQLSIIS